MENKNKNITEAIEYINLKKTEEKDLNKIKDDITVQVQGESVELLESDNLLYSMLAYISAYKFSPELIYKSKSGDRFLLFDHQAVPVLRPDDINEELLLESIVFKKIEKEEEIEIEAEKIYKKCQGEGELEKVKNYLGKIKDRIKPAEKLIFIGKGENLAFLIALKLYYDMADEVFYKEDEDSELIKIK